jgi:hypothetical protein
MAAPDAFATVPPEGASSPRVWWRGLPPRRRKVLRALSAFGVIVILIVGAGLARFLSAENAERDDELALIQAEIKGDAAGMLAQLGGCKYPWVGAPGARSAAARACVDSVSANAHDARLRRTGAVKILQLESKAVKTPAGATTKSRVAWTVIGTLPVVQCVEVRRTGDFLSGVHVQLVGVSAPIHGEGKCWKESQIEREEEEATKVEQGR